MDEIKSEMEKLGLTDRDMLVKDLLKMLEQGSLNDVKIKLSDGEIVANKDILMARSDYFAAMFRNNNFIEGETGSADMSHCSKAVMERIIKFLFSGEVKFDKLSLPQLIELSYTTDMMLLPKFKDTLEDYARSYLVVNNEDNDNIQFLPEIISGLKLADEYNLTNLKEIIIWELNLCLDYDVRAKDYFSTLPFNLMKDIILCEDEYFFQSVQQEKLKAFMIWLSENEVSEEQKTEIVESFKFEDFTAEELLTSVRDSGLYSAKRIDERVLELRNMIKEESE